MNVFISFTQICISLTGTIYGLSGEGVTAYSSYREMTHRFKGIVHRKIKGCQKRFLNAPKMF